MQPKAATVKYGFIDISKEKFDLYYYCTRESMHVHCWPLGHFNSVNVVSWTNNPNPNIFLLHVISMAACERCDWEVTEHGGGGSILPKWRWVLEDAKPAWITRVLRGVTSLRLSAVPQNLQVQTKVNQTFSCDGGQAVLVVFLHPSGAI